MIPWDKERWPKVCEGLIQLAVAEYVQWWRVFVVPNLRLFHEMDVAVLTPAGCLWEFEIKVTQKDWEADKRKDDPARWSRRNLKYVERFYYAVAPGLVAPDWLPEWAGIVRAQPYKFPNGEGEYLQIRHVRRAKGRRAEKPTERHREAIYRAAHARFWDRVMRMPVPDAIAVVNGVTGGTT